jgi:hypothetical protein
MADMLTNRLSRWIKGVSVKTVNFIAPEEGGDVRAAAMAKSPDGRDYVRVDTDQHLFDATSIKDYPKIAHKIIIDKFRGKVIGEAPQNAFVKTLTAGEYAYGGKPLPTTEKSAKMRASSEIDNLLRAGEFLEHKADDGSHPEAVGGWDYYRTIFEVGGKFFEGKVNIQNNKKGRVFYDVTDVKEMSQGLMTQYDKSQGQFPKTKSSISQDGEKRNSQVRPLGCDFISLSHFLIWCRYRRCPELLLDLDSLRSCNAFRA